MEIRKSIKKFREEAGLSQRDLASLVGKSESAIQGYEGGQTDIPLKTLTAIAKSLKVSLGELEAGERKKPEVREEKPVELRIYTLEERLNVAAILIKNGYRVSQSKRNRTQTGKIVDYYLVIEDNAAGTDTSR